MQGACPVGEPRVLRGEGETGGRGVGDERRIKVPWANIEPCTSQTESFTGMVQAKGCLPWLLCDPVWRCWVGSSPSPPGNELERPPGHESRVDTDLGPRTRCIYTYSGGWGAYLSVACMRRAQVSSWVSFVSCPRANLELAT